MLRDKDFRFVLAFTMAAMCLGIATLALQPSEGRTITAQAGGNFEAPVAGVGGHFYRLASAE